MRREKPRDRSPTKSSTISKIMGLQVFFSSQSRGTNNHQECTNSRITKRYNLHLIGGFQQNELTKVGRQKYLQNTLLGCPMEKPRP